MCFCIDNALVVVASVGSDSYYDSVVVFGKDYLSLGKWEVKLWVLRGWVVSRALGLAVGSEVGMPGERAGALSVVTCVGWIPCKLS